MRPAALLSSLVLTALLAPSSAAAQTTTPLTEAQQKAADAAARQAMYASCGDVEATTLPNGVAPGIYQGTLGGRPVTLELAARARSDTELQDRYSYDRYGIDVGLERGRPADRTATQTLAEVESVIGEDDFQPHARACLQLSAIGGTGLNSTGLSGSWRPVGGKALPLTLRRVNVAALPLALPSSPGLLTLRAKDPYTFVKVNRPWAKVVGGLKEPYTGVSYPRVAGGTAALNAALQDRQLSLVTDALDCLTDYGNRDGRTDYQGSGTLSWRSRSLTSVDENVELYCGGAHPDAYTAGVTLDARTGREVTLAAKPGTLWSGLSAAKLQAMYLARYPKDGDLSECQDELAGDEGKDTEYGFPYALYLTKQGLAVWPNYLPHVALACAEVVTLPYSSLRGLANPKSPYFRDLYSR